MDLTPGPSPVEREAMLGPDRRWKSLTASLITASIFDAERLKLVACLLLADYTYISSGDYIATLEFEFVETWSLQRGAEYEASHARMKKEHDTLQRRRLPTVEEKERYNELHPLIGFTQYLIDPQGRFHPSGQKVNTFLASDLRIAEIKAILRTEIKDVPYLMCAPTYRDAFVFRSGSGSIVSTLNVCLSCLHMEASRFKVNGDWATYEALKQFFVRNGHDVEDPGKPVFF